MYIYMYMVDRDFFAIIQVLNIVHCHEEVPKTK